MLTEDQARLRMLRTALRWPRLALALTMVVAFAACGDDDDDDDSDGGATGDGEAPAEITAACDRLEDLANAVLDVRDAQTASEVSATVQPAIDAFVEAADDSGDDRLAGLATTVDDSFSAYLSGGDSAAARNTVDSALDGAGARCIELGATNDFPEEPPASGG